MGSHFKTAINKQTALKPELHKTPDSSVSSKDKKDAKTIKEFESLVKKGKVKVNAKPNSVYVDYKELIKHIMFHKGIVFAQSLCMIIAGMILANWVLPVLGVLFALATNEDKRFRDIHIVYAQIIKEEDENL